MTRPNYDGPPDQSCPFCGDYITPALEDLGRDNREHRFAWTCPDCGREIAQAHRPFRNGPLPSTLARAGDDDA